MKLKTGTVVNAAELEGIAESIIRLAFDLDSLEEAVNDINKDLSSETTGKHDQIFTSEEADEIIEFLEPICKPFSNRIFEFWQVQSEELENIIDMKEATNGPGLTPINP